MTVHVVTLFPGFFRGPLDEGILGRAVTEGRVRVDLVDLRPFGEGRHRVTDDYPFGGGAGMVMKPGPVVDAIEHVRRADADTRVVLLTPQGRPFCQEVAREFAGAGSLTLVCGRYEGFDERIRAFCDDEVSVGDYVLMGGEAAAWVVIEATARLIPGVLGDAASPEDESLSAGLLEYPQYTRPREFRGLRVPDVLLSGHHGEIAAWRRRQAVIRTARRRPDLLERADLSGEERELARRVLRGETVDEG
ncbi:tRNA (guanosine(37)-N1)-methyltransferase TrmD [Deferrisoma camini]|uniref:tRNA (guanosine(37)-N1)-methyltransferase TrmD n=1 Tax=Deferrisoma camini TaxID=1035120 RepID=UPI00046D0BB2